MATKTLATQLAASIGWQHVLTTDDGVSISDAASLAFSKSLTDGTGAAGTGDRVFHNKYVIAGGGNQQLDLAASLTDQFGAVVTFARIKAILIQVLDSADDALSLGGPVLVGGGSDGTGTAAFVNWVAAANDKLRVRPGGCFALLARDATCYVVTATSADILRLENESGGSSVIVKVAIIGSSA